MEKSLKQMVDDEVMKRCKPKVNKQENKQESSNKKNSPHLALCHTDNPSANNRHKSLMIKSKDDATICLVNLVKSEHKAPDDFEYFCRGMADLEVLSALYSAMAEANDETLQELINKGKKQ